ncbi:MAG: glycosyltransferase [Kiritimatiellae bacterium]|nr:glycosyltransferase [Kiritimatiellia bacterium]
MKGNVWLFKKPDLPECHLIRGLASQSIPQLVFMRPEIDPPASLNMPSIRVERLSVRSLWDPSAIKAIRAALSSERYSTIYATDTKPLANAIWAARYLPIKVIAYRGTCSLKRLDPVNWMTYLNPRVDQIVCVSDAVLNYLVQRGLPREKLVRIYKGHDPYWYKKGTRTQLLDLGIPKDAFVVGCSASMRPLKGVYEMLLSLKYLPTDHPVRMLLVGQIRDVRIPRLLKHEPCRSKVHVLGHRNDAVAWMGACNAFVMPSLYGEGLPKAVIEAMSLEVPPIVTAVGGMSELVQDRECGIVIPPASPEAIAEAIRLLYQDPTWTHQLGQQAKQQIESRFHLASMVKAFLAILNG